MHIKITCFIQVCMCVCTVSELVAGRCVWASLSIVPLLPLSAKLSAIQDGKQGYGIFEHEL